MSPGVPEIPRSPAHGLLYQPMKFRKDGRFAIGLVAALLAHRRHGQEAALGQSSKFPVDRAGTHAGKSDQLLRCCSSSHAPKMRGSSRFPERY
jgi:hypothetical protein